MKSSTPPFVLFKDSLSHNLFNSDVSNIFSNVISNAVDHGFKDSTKENFINCSIYYASKSEECVIEISNNGKPIPEGFTLNNLITRGDKTSGSEGTGVGGADIKKIVEKYTGSFNLISDKDLEFPVIYIIGFPLIKLEEDEL